MKFNQYLIDISQSLPIHNCLIWFVNVSLVDFDREVFMIKVTLKKISFCWKASKREFVFIETLENLYFKFWCINNFSQKMR